MGRRNFFSTYAICVAIASLVSGCSVPNLESENCTAGRETVKKLYSQHFGSEMSSDPEALRQRDKFLTNTLIEELRSADLPSKDYFTRTGDTPTAFRVGTCEESGPTSVKIQVILLWRSRETNRQAEVHAEVIEQDHNWLVNKVFE